jgi:DNA helicase-2/ATP-dependent DNA helicase PcrA
VPKRGIGERAEACVEAAAQRDRVTFAAALARPDGVPGLATRSVSSITEFNAMVSGLRDLVAAGTAPSQLAEAVLDRTGYLAELAESQDPQDEGRIENLSQLIAVAREFEAARPDGTLVDFLEQISLVADADQIPAGEDRGGLVTLMTLHTAKGLEFPVVFLTGMEESVFPHQRSLTDAKAWWGRPAYHPAARFLTEIPAELVDWRRTEASVTVAPASEQVASRPGVRTIGNRDVPALSPGDRVTHDAFGLGTVVSVGGVGERAEAKIDFGGEHGVRHLILRYAPIEKL